MRALPSAPAALALTATLSAVLLTPGTAHAAGKHPWSEYFPKAGTVCTSTMTVEGESSTVRTKVLRKNKSGIRVRVLGQRTSATFDPRGRLGMHERSVERDDIGLVETTSDVSVPSPAALARGKKGGGWIQVTVTPREPKGLLVPGARRGIIRVPVAVTGLGRKDVTLAPSGTPGAADAPQADVVRAVGHRIVTGRARAQNFTPRAGKKMLATLGDVFSLRATSWSAPGRGEVFSTLTVFGSTVEVRQVGCS